MKVVTPCTESRRMLMKNMDEYWSEKGAAVEAPGDAEYGSKASITTQRPARHRTLHRLE